MVEDPEVARDHLVLENGAVGNVDPRAVVGHDDDSAGQRNARAKGHVARDGQVVEFL